MIIWYVVALLVAFPGILGAQSILETDDGSLFRAGFALLAALGAVSFLTGISGGGRLQLIRSAPFKILAMLLLYGVVQTWIHQNASRSFFEAKQLNGLVGVIVTLLPLVGVGFLLRTEEDLRKCMWGVRIALACITGSVLVCAFLYQFGIEFGEVLDIGGIPTRFFGPLGDQVGFISAFGFFLALASSRWGWAFLHLVAVMFTGTRGILPVLGVGLLLFTYFSSNSGVASKRTLTMVRVLGAIALLVGVLVSPAGQTITDRITNQSQLSAGVSSRGAALELGIEIFSENPIFGVGFSGYTGAALDRGAHLMFKTFQLGLIANAANPYLDIAVSGGVVALALYLILLCNVWICGSRSVARAPSVIRNDILGFQLWYGGMVIGLQSAAFALPLSLILVFFGTAAVILVACQWVQYDQPEAIGPDEYSERSVVAHG